MAPHQLIYLFARGCFEPRLHLFTHHWGCQRHERVCATARVRLHVQWMLQQAHLVAMCQCHWPLCSPSGWYTRSASSDSCSIRGPSRLTDAQTHKRRATQTRVREQKSSKRSRRKRGNGFRHSGGALHILIALECCSRSSEITVEADSCDSGWRIRDTFCFVFVVCFIFPS